MCHTKQRKRVYATEAERSAAFRRMYDLWETLITTDSNAIRTVSQQFEVSRDTVIRAISRHIGKKESENLQSESK